MVLSLRRWSNTLTATVRMDLALTTNAILSPDDPLMGSGTVAPM